MGADVGDDSIALRLLRYERSQKLCNYIGGGIGGLLVVVGLSGSTLANAPWWMASVIITLVVFAAVFLGRAYIGFLSSHYELVRYQKAQKREDTDQVPDTGELGYPSATFMFFKISSVLLFLAGLVLLVGIWFPPR